VKHVFFAAALVAAPLSGAAEMRASDGRIPIFRAAADVVALTVTVVDENADHVEGLSLADFVVLEDGIEQAPSFFTASAAPVDITLLVDASASMTDKIATARDAVRRITRNLRDVDRAAIVAFRETPTAEQGMTGDRAALDAAIGRIACDGGTALYTALYITLSGMDSRPPGDGLRRRAVVVLSDGDDTASLVGIPDVLEKAHRVGVAIYAVSLQSPVEHGMLRRVGHTMPVSDGDRALQSLARETGGVAFFPTEVRALPDVYRGIARELERQYVIGYTPREATDEGAWRAVRVRLPAHPRLTVRTRSGYYAGDGPAFAASRLDHDRH